MLEVRNLESRKVREESFQIAQKYEQRGLSADLAAVVMKYTYYLDTSLEIYTSAQQVLDAGSRDKKFSEALKPLGFAARVTSIDQVATTQIDAKTKIEKLPFKDGAFNVVVARWAIPDVITPQTDINLLQDEIAELYRVTKPGGRLIFTPIKLYFDQTQDSSAGIKDAMYIQMLTFLNQVHTQNPATKISIARVFFDGSADQNQQKDFTETLEILK